MAKVIVFIFCWICIGFIFQFIIPWIAVMMPEYFPAVMNPFWSIVGGFFGSAFLLSQMK